MIPNEENGKEKKCGGLLNQLFSPPKDIDLLQKKCNKPYNNGSSLCPPVFDNIIFDSSFL